MLGVFSEFKRAMIQVISVRLDPPNRQSKGSAIMKCVPCPFPLTIIVLSVVFFSWQAVGARTQPECTPIPTLYENWKQVVVTQEMHRQIDTVSDGDVII
jgi:hypothetical protein